MDTIAESEQGEWHSSTYGSMTVDGYSTVSASTCNDSCVVDRCNTPLASSTTEAERQSDRSGGTNQCLWTPPGTNSSATTVSEIQPLHLMDEINVGQLDHGPNGPTHHDPSREFRILSWLEPSLSVVIVLLGLHLPPLDPTTFEEFPFDGDLGSEQAAPTHTFNQPWSPEEVRDEASGKPGKLITFSRNTHPFTDSASDLPHDAFGSSAPSCLESHYSKAEMLGKKCRCLEHFEFALETSPNPLRCIPDFIHPGTRFGVDYGCKADPSQSKEMSRIGKICLRRSSSRASKFVMDAGKPLSSPTVTARIWNATT